MHDTPPQRGLWRGANLVALVLLFLAFLGIGLFVGVYERTRAELPSVARLEHWEPNLVTKVFSRDGEVVAEFASERREIVPLDRVPRNFIRAILATEDRSFWQHDGIHLPRLIRVGARFLLTGSKRQGASTITMQLSRNLFLTPDKTVVRKAKEMILAHEIEQFYSKEKILEMYVNQVYFGSGAYGIESAARSYFAKPATDLTLSEAAMLAGIIQSPSRQSPRVNREAARERRAVVLGNLAEVGAISEATARRIGDTPIELAPPPPLSGPDSYFAEHVRRRLEEMLGTDAVWRGGYRVHTTLDSELQERAETVVEERLREIEKTLPPDRITRAEWLARRDSLLAVGDTAAAAAVDSGPRTPYLQGALLSVDLETGGIVAMVGGRDFEESKFNRITQARRQPGSVFKPFVYTAAIRNGFPPSYVVQDEPLSMPMGNGEMWEPVNYDRKFRGPVTLRRALTNSINVATVRLLFDVGIQAVIDYARDAGITTELPPFGSLGLGAADVIPFEVLRAYTVYPNRGERITPIAITRIEDRNGNVVRQFEAPRARVLSPQEAYVVTTILEDVVDHGTARWGVRGHGFEWPAAGKTGTTNESTDAWFVGFTPEYITLAWVGFDRKQRIRYNGTGGVLAAPIWTAFMKTAHEGLEPPEEGFVEPPGLDRVQVTRTTGMLAADFCGMPSYSEIVIPGTAPDHYCFAPREDAAPMLGSGEDDGPERKAESVVDEDYLF
ncbi:MAG: PBP1A family penicillin-binding protein [Gemmatimonadota bacterium]|nr:PBP1A family penicillin-binding protein [Gemmatimonadota bacterium]